MFKNKLKMVLPMFAVLALTACKNEKKPYSEEVKNNMINGCISKAQQTIDLEKGLTEEQKSAKLSMFQGLCECSVSVLEEEISEKDVLAAERDILASKKPSEKFINATVKVREKCVPKMDALKK